MLLTRRELCSALGAIAAGILPARGLAAENTAAFSLSSGLFDGFEMMAVPEKKAESIATEQESYLGSLAPVIRSIQQEHGFPLAYERRGELSDTEWRKQGRAAITNGLGYQPASVPLDLRLERTVSRPGYELRVISFAGTSHYRIPAFLLIPEGKGPFPAVVALHDHGSEYYFGKEKLVEMDPEHAALTSFKKVYYGGRSYASELARNGYVVLVADCFYWGERRLKYAYPPSNYRQAMAGLDESSEQYVSAVDDFLEQRTADLITLLGYTGLNWLGIVSYDDMRAVDLLVSLPEVDSRRIGCIGLSGGGFRSTYLAGRDARIRAGVIVAWMNTLPTTLDLAEKSHADIFDSYVVHAGLDHPDVASLGAPDCALFVLNCGRDELFTAKGMRLAVEKIRSVYQGMNHANKFQARVYDVPHLFNTQMQKDAFLWLDRWLK
jgi:dienelactone hydrolase